MKAEADSEVHVAPRPVKKSSKKPVRSSPRKSVQKYDEVEQDLTVSDDELDELKHDDYQEESASEEYEDEDAEDA